MSSAKTRRRDIAGVIARRREQVIASQETWALIRRIVLLALILALVLTQVFLIAQVEGQGMFPAVKDGDLAVVFRLQDRYMRSDVIAYQHEGERHFGRIVATAGSEVTIDGAGNLLVNGQLQSGEILFPTQSRDGEVFSMTVPQGCVFVLGDYRTNTLDSRDFGPIPLTEVEGKLITILRRRGL